MSTNLHDCSVLALPGDPLLDRVYPAPEHAGRDGFERDRERVVQSRAFRRLAGKTQVFTSRASDHFRSRLTHTIEVAQIAREVSCRLGLNEPLAETLALVHDIGHPPFGHAGERTLDNCLQQHGLRFDHNLHALRIVEHFEQRYAAHRGLNLTLGVREGIIKHSRDYTVAEHPELRSYFLDQQPPLEAQIIDLADEIAYLTADLDDGVESGLLEIDHIREHVPLFGLAYLDVAVGSPSAADKYLFYEALQLMQNRLTDDLVQTTASNVLALDLVSLDTVRHHPTRLAVFSPAMEEARQQEKRYLHRYLYGCPELDREHDKAEDVVSSLFQFWISAPEELPSGYQEEIVEEGLARTVADYIAGMTDAYILQQFALVRRAVR